MDTFKNEYDNLIKNIDNQNINGYMNFIHEQLFTANKYFNDQEPWKKKNDRLRLNTILYVSLELIRKISILLYPVIPDTSVKVLNVFSISESEIFIDTIQNHSILVGDKKIKKLTILFKKIKND